MREAWPTARLICVFQPHRYTRTQDCFDEFVQVLQVPDQVVLLDIYAASEKPIEGVTADQLATAIQQAGQTCSRVDKADLVSTLQTLVHDADVVLFQGAGDVVALAKHVAEPA
jgi:UDP-N-acetylmuramate--alanine ligase